MTTQNKLNANGRPMSPNLDGDDILDLTTAEAILKLHGGSVVEDEVPLSKKTEAEYIAEGKPFPKSWFLLDNYGTMSLQGGTEDEAKVTGAMLLYLFERGVSVDVARDLACSYMDRRIGREVRK
jgi:hypothetical protein